jgi:hypothetical protein
LPVCAWAATADSSEPDTNSVQITAKMIRFLIFVSMIFLPSVFCNESRRLFSLQKVFLLALSIEEAFAAVHTSPHRIIVGRIQAVVIAARNVTTSHIFAFNIIIATGQSPKGVQGN